MSDQYRDSVRQMDRKIYEQLVNSLATGRWPDGRTLTADQRAHAMQAVITWGEMHLRLRREWVLSIKARRRRGVRRADNLDVEGFSR